MFSLLKLTPPLSHVLFKVRAVVNRLVNTLAKPEEKVAAKEAKNAARRNATYAERHGHDAGYTISINTRMYIYMHVNAYVYINIYAYTIAAAKEAKNAARRNATYEERHGHDAGYIYMYTYI